MHLAAQIAALIAVVSTGVVYGTTRSAHSSSNPPSLVSTTLR